MRVKMKTGLSGPRYSLSPGDECEFSEYEAARLIAAGFAELVETDEERAARVDAERNAANAAAEARAAELKKAEDEAAARAAELKKAEDEAAARANAAAETDSGKSAGGGGRPSEGGASAAQKQASAPAKRKSAKKA